MMTLVWFDRFLSWPRIHSVIWVENMVCSENIKTWVQIPSIHIKKQTKDQARLGVMVTSALRCRDKQILKAHWLTSLAENACFWFSERPCLKKVSRKVMEEDTQCPVLSSVWTHTSACIYTAMCMSSQRETWILSLRLKSKMWINFRSRVPPYMKILVELIIILLLFLITPYMPIDIRKRIRLFW